MESNAVKLTQEAVQSLEANRAVVRALILPRDPGAPDNDVFPRSGLVRFVLDARRRRLAYGVITAMWMLMGRRRRRHWL